MLEHGINSAALVVDVVGLNTFAIQLLPLDGQAAAVGLLDPSDGSEVAVNANANRAAFRRRLAALVHGNNSDTNALGAAVLNADLGVATGNLDHLVRLVAAGLGKFTVSLHIVATLDEDLVVVDLARGSLPADANLEGLLAGHADSMDRHALLGVASLLTFLLDAAHLALAALLVLLVFLVLLAVITMGRNNDLGRREIIATGVMSLVLLRGIHDSPNNQDHQDHNGDDHENRFVVHSFFSLSSIFSLATYLRNDRVRLVFPVTPEK